MLIFHYLNYKGVAEDYENVAGAMLLDEFEHEYHNRITAIKLYVSENDLRNRIVENETSPPA